MRTSIFLGLAWLAACAADDEGGGTADTGDAGTGDGPRVLFDGGSEACEIGPAERCDDACDGEGADFYCTVACASNDECPDQNECVEWSPGVTGCMHVCERAEDCPEAEWGPGFCPTSGPTAGLCFW